MEYVFRLSTNPPLTDDERERWIRTFLDVAGALERREDLTRAARFEREHGADVGGALVFTGGR